ncbi:ADR023Cp [Eremothecium gossypii ATCC 10895]|uniref:ADR023Cp n=1 Tax=Eremothecium gossypii (strain ATCC 10895 / CBS 109.51 / FGSC 9923 / NRRL Y-1056) TaxID=284811 RepID=Q75A95_EREGS|nr:ADR023Cp [Eremothecium gossypii ATCC 10895]AAS51943.1 ADR023Cp [Eremothecium gossypii ATCC 10895]AEY96243.1 FADR023Cp [Eremothecium gossypii FDAG1]
MLGARNLRPLCCDRVVLGSRRIGSGIRCGSTETANVADEMTRNTLDSVLATSEKLSSSVRRWPRPRRAAAARGAGSEKHIVLTGPFSMGLQEAGATELPPRLAHGLERCLFQPLSVVPLRDRRSGVYNFEPFIERVIKVQDFDFEAIADFVPPSRDLRLLERAKEGQARYVSSTSAMSGVLSHLHYLLSNFRPLNGRHLSATLLRKDAQVTKCCKMTSSMLLQRRSQAPPIFSLSSDSSADREIILSQLGHALEALLTTDQADFARIYDKGKRAQPGSQPLGKGHATSAFRFNKHGRFLLRSQLDAHDPKLPGTGVFDLKTRAVAAVRHDLDYVSQNGNTTGYQLMRRSGQFESYEREISELVRNAMLKYSFQARIGAMDGIFVAYHNISRIFGFQYIPLEEMDYIIHSSADRAAAMSLTRRESALQELFNPVEYVTRYRFENTARETASTLAQAEFNYSMRILEHLFDEITSYFPESVPTVRIMLKTVEHKDKPPSMVAIATPLDTKQSEQLEKFNLQREFLNSDPVSFTRHVNELHDFYHSVMPGSVKFTVSVKHSMSQDQKPVWTRSSAFFKRNKADQQKLMDAASSDYYGPHWKHPYFFSPEDVSRWNIRVSISNPVAANAREYAQLLQDDIAFLDGQAVVKKKETISNGKHGKMATAAKGSQLDQVSQLQALLRAFGIKGQKDEQVTMERDRRSKNKYLLMWDGQKRQRVTTDPKDLTR